MFTYLKRFSIGTILVIAAALFTIFNPYSSLDLLAFLLIAFIILQKIFGEYFILLLLALRPVLDYWRDYGIFSFRTFDFNINAALSSLLLIWSVYFFIRHGAEFKKIPAKWPWLLFILWSAFSAIYSYDTAATIAETMKAANLFALYGISYILAARDSEKFTKRFCWAMAAAAIVPLSAALYQYISGAGLDIDGVANRIYGTFAHPNILATFALLLLMVLFNQAIVKKSEFWIKHPGWDKAAGIFLLLIIALTYTRIAWIGAALFLAATGLIYFRQAVIWFVTGIIAFYVLFFPVNALLVDNFNFNLQSFGLIARLTSRNEEADSIQWRADIANKVLPLWQERPLQGYGYGSFAKVWDDHKGVANLWDNTSEAHNDYLKVGFEDGIIGLILFLSIFAGMIWRQFKYGRAHHWINIVFISSLVVYLVLSASDNMLHHTPVIWWMWAVWGWWSTEYSE